MASTRSDGAFDALMADLDPAMLVVTVAGVGDGRGDGCLVGFHSQCSIRPRRYAVWLSEENRTYRLAREANHLGVHLLRADQHALMALFGGETGDEVDKLAQCSWSPGPEGVPLLDDVAHRFVGHVLSVHDLGCDHHCAIVEPLDAQHPAPLEPSRLHHATDIHAGHPA